MGAPAFLLTGEVDVAMAPRIARELSAHAAEHVGDVVIDCSDLEFLDSTGVQVLVDLQQRLQAEGRRLDLVDLPEQTRRVLEIAGLAELFGVGERGLEPDSAG